MLVLIISVAVYLRITGIMYCCLRNLLTIINFIWLLTAPMKRKRGQMIELFVGYLGIKFIIFDWIVIGLSRSSAYFDILLFVKFFGCLR